jgi:2,5-diamino-6-(ribosylamino)-4(3H)-pyrimidinone 5'-phosphate reductase
MAPVEDKLLSNRMTDRPYVILNVAMTADGKTDTFARRGAAISSPLDRERVDRLRADSDAILVGGRTLTGDDPRLTVKSAALRARRMERGLAENPVKVAVISNARLAAGSHFLTAGPARKIIFTTTQTDPVQVEWLFEQGVQVYVMGERQVDLKGALQCLKEQGIHRLLVEGGGTLNEELLKQNLVDEIRVYIAPMIFGGAESPTFASGAGLESQSAIPLEQTGVEKLADGGIVVYYAVRTGLAVSSDLGRNFKNDTHKTAN